MFKSDSQSSNGLKVPFLSAEDFAMALLLAYSGEDPSFSLDPEDSNNPEGPFLRKVYPINNIRTFRTFWIFRKFRKFRTFQYFTDWNSLTCCKYYPHWMHGTEFGEVMFEADFLLKQLAFDCVVDPTTGNVSARSYRVISQLKSEVISNAEGRNAKKNKLNVFI